MLCSQWFQFLLDIVRLHFKPWTFLLLTFFNRILGILLSVLVVVKLQGGIDELLGVQCLIAMAVLPFSLWMVREDLTLKIDFSWIRELVQFGYPFIFAGLAYWLFGSMDRWMLAKMTSVSETGIYSVAFRFSSLALFISAAFGKAWSPISMKLRKDSPETYRSIYAQVLLLLLFAMSIIGGGLALFSGELMYVLMPTEYSASALPMSILCFGIILQSTQQVTAIGISLEKKTFLFARLTWLTAFINLILNCSLIPLYGAAGAACATSLSYLALTGSFFFFTQQCHPLPIDWKKLGLLSGVVVSIGLLALSLAAYSFNWKVVACKLISLALLTAIAYAALPLKSFRYER